MRLDQEVDLGTQKVTGGVDGDCDEVRDTAYWLFEWSKKRLYQGKLCRLICNITREFFENNLSLSSWPPVSAVHN